MQLTPYLTFAGDARTAMEFYQSVLGGRLDVLTYGSFGIGPAESADGVMHSYLATDTGLTLSASDAGEAWGRDPVRRGNDFAVAVMGDAADESAMRGYFDAFAAAGTVDVALEKQPWGDYFGQVTDQFGIAWMFNIGGEGSSPEASS